MYIYIEMYIYIVLMYILKTRMIPTTFFHEFETNVGQWRSDLHEEIIDNKLMNISNEDNSEEEYNRRVVKYTKPNKTSPSVACSPSVGILFVKDEILSKFCRRLDTGKIVHYNVLDCRKRKVFKHGDVIYCYLNKKIILLIPSTIEKEYIEHQQQGKQYYLPDSYSIDFLLNK